MAPCLGIAVENGGRIAARSPPRLQPPTAHSPPATQPGHVVMQLPGTRPKGPPADSASHTPFVIWAPLTIHDTTPRPVPSVT